MPGKFIVFEGLDGSGKSTVLGAVGQYLRHQNLPVLATREPGGTELGAMIRELVLGQDPRPSGRAELLLMCADRAEHVETVIAPALARGTNVLSDRFEASTRAYQGSGLGIDESTVLQSIAAATGGLVPDLYLLFDVDPSVAHQRRMADSGAINALDQRAFDFRQRVRERYLTIAATEPNWQVLDANRALDVVTAKATGLVTDCIKSTTNA